MSRLSDRPKWRQVQGRVGFGDYTEQGVGRMSVVKESGPRSLGSCSRMDIRFLLNDPYPNHQKDPYTMGKETEREEGYSPTNVILTEPLQHQHGVGRLAPLSPPSPSLVLPPLLPALTPSPPARLRTAGTRTYLSAGCSPSLSPVSPPLRRRVARRYGCGVCGALFAVRSNLKRHVVTVHEGRREFACDRCPATFGLKQNLLTHVRVKHDKWRPFACESCGGRFGYKQVLKNHKKNVHGI